MYILFILAGLMSNYHILTPENRVISFEMIKGKNLQALLSEKDVKEIPEEYPAIDILGRKAFLLSAGRIVHVIYPSLQTGILFKDQNDYIKANRSKEYFATTIIIDKEKSLHYSFNLENAIDFYKKTLRKLDQFPEHEGFNAYLLPEDRICYVRKLSDTRYQGYWYADLENFEYFYALYTNEETGPSTKLTTI